MADTVTYPNEILYKLVLSLTMGAKIVIPKESPFSIHNIPFGIISTSDNQTPRCAAAIGDYAIDLAKLAEASCLDHLGLEPSAQEMFNKVRKKGLPLSTSSLINLD